MSATIPESHLDLINGPVLATLVTLMPDGGPQASLVWCNYDGRHILVNTAAGRQKERNMRARPAVALLAFDPKDPYRYLEVRGRVVEITEEGALAHINELARLYENRSVFFGQVAPAERQATEVRLICKIEPVKVNVH